MKQQLLTTTHICLADRQCKLHSVPASTSPVLSCWQGCVGCSHVLPGPHDTVTLPVKLPEQAAVQADVLAQLAGQEGMPGRGRGGEEHTARAAAAAAGSFQVG
jgi:hypothetical protein